jgi:RNA recognition motif-containing protein
MNKKLFVGRLPFEFSNDQLRALFIGSGAVVSAVMVPDGKNGRTRGFGFVDMSTEAQAQAAIQSLNGTPLADKKIWVTLAREKGEAKPPAAVRKPVGDRRPFRSASMPHDDRPRSKGPSRFPKKEFSPRRNSPAPRFKNQTVKGGSSYGSEKESKKEVKKQKEVTR